MLASMLDSSMVCHIHILKLDLHLSLFHVLLFSVRPCGLNISVVKNHGIPQDITDAAIEAGKEFFVLPDETKFKVRCLSSHLTHSFH